ncbi:MAG: hypothetical protein JRI97_09720 [Deltaproteobacteria bacterium]|nr:hypothetical protein [Deltaproteobacteria bacterium]
MPKSVWENWYLRLNARRWLLLSTLVYLVFQGALLAILAPLGKDPLILQTTFSPAVFSGILQSWGGEGIAI